VTFDGTTARVPAVNGGEAASRTTLLAGPHSVRALSTTGTDSRTEIEVRNIGGISNAELTISPGVTLISGENASLPTRRSTRSNSNGSETTPS